MTADRKAALLAGAFFILATAMGVFNAITLAPLLGNPDFLVAMSENARVVNTSTLLNIIMSGAVIAIAMVLYPILARFSKTLAVSYLAARSIEGILLAIGGMTWISLSTLGTEFIQAGQPTASHYQTLALLFTSGSTAIFTLAAEITFGITALILNYVFLKTRLLPRFISIWGLIGGALILILGIMKILGLPISAVEIPFTAPIALNEMVLAVWLLVKGFSTPVKSA